MTIQFITNENKIFASNITNLSDKLETAIYLMYESKYGNKKFKIIGEPVTYGYMSMLDRIF